MTMWTTSQRRVSNDPLDYRPYHSACAVGALYRAGRTLPYGIQRVFSVAGVACTDRSRAWSGLASLGRFGDLLRLGDWAAPFGIVIVGDRLSTLMVLLTSVLALFVLLYSIGSGWMIAEGIPRVVPVSAYGHLGAFLTGDLFNLFVFFEVLLIASYGIDDPRGRQCTAARGRAICLVQPDRLDPIPVRTWVDLCRDRHTHMADLAERVKTGRPGRNRGHSRRAVLLLLVFAIKAALVPLHFWLPSSYAEAPAPVAALFAIMTKVGAYAIIRVYTMVFPPDLEVTSGLHDVWLLPAALVSLAIGMIGVLAAKKLDRLVAFSVVGSMGMVMVAISLFSPAGIAAALYYIVHSTLAGAVLFLISDLVRTGRGNVDLTAQAPMLGTALTAGMFFAGAIAMAACLRCPASSASFLVLEAAI